MTEEGGDVSLGVGVVGEKRRSRRPTPAELRVLECAMEGMTDREAATYLGVAHSTAKTQVVSAIRRVHALSRTHAVVICLREGWLEL
jgi:DNA-binding NarL/FixJ family response regulator